jgi:hypothetical protein
LASARIRSTQNGQFLRHLKLKPNADLGTMQ